MNRTGIEAAVKAARLFLAYAEQVEYGDSAEYPHMREYVASGPKLTGGLRRASLDLTRRLAEMRKP